VARRIRIERIGISLQVVQGDGIDAPLGKAAHHPDTGWPGSGTNVFIYAHARNGMFLPLWDAKLGDEVQLDLVTGVTVRYTVSKILPEAAWNDLALAQPTPGEKLTLETCTSYGPTAPRFVVIADPITP
jgi:LPXTG-site transpeptidase (sortase) family protein